MSQHGQVARLQGGPAGAEPSLAELLDPVALEARLVEARARRMEAIARRKAAAEAETEAEAEADSESGESQERAPVPSAPVRADDQQSDLSLSSPSPAIRHSLQESPAIAIASRRPMAERSPRGGPERPVPPRVAQARSGPLQAEPSSIGTRPAHPAGPGQQGAPRLPLPAPPPRIGPTATAGTPPRTVERLPVQPLHTPAQASPAQISPAQISPAQISPAQIPEPARPQAGTGRRALVLGATFAAGMAGAVAALVLGPPAMRSWMPQQAVPSPAAPGAETSIRAPEPVAANRSSASGEPASTTAAHDVPAGPLARAADSVPGRDAMPSGPALSRTATGASPLAPALPSAGRAPGNPTALALADQPAEPGLLLAAPYVAEPVPSLPGMSFAPAPRGALRFDLPAPLPAGVVRASLLLPGPTSSRGEFTSYELTPSPAVLPPAAVAAATPTRNPATSARSGQTRTTAQRQAPRLPAGQADDAESVARIVLERTVEGMLRDRLGKN